MTQVPLHSRFEAAFESALAYENPVQDVRVTVEFTNAMHVYKVDAFWDGEQCWRVRFAPSRIGKWSWQTHCTRSEDAGLDGQTGEFSCIETTSSNDWIANGPLQVSADLRHLEFANGAPFFWLADTAWNGPLKAGATDWEVYLADRKLKGFSVVQFVATQWLGCARDAEGRTAYTNGQKIQIEPAFFQRLDRRIDRINDFGFVAAPVLAWAATWNKDGISLSPGASLGEDQLIVLIRYIVSRYGAHHVVWILAGDGNYLGAEGERWRRIGRATLDCSPRLATMHPAGRIWVNKEFEGESWYSFNAYQSSQWKGPESSRWINERAVVGPCADINAGRPMPTIDLEPCYEGHLPLDLPGPDKIDDYAVRRACYWSLLAAPVAGVSYGAHGVWSWEESRAVPLNHPDSGMAQSWKDAIDFPGSESVSHLRVIFDSIQWWRLNPCQEMLDVQPGTHAPLEFIAAACSPERDVAVLYVPVGGVVSLQSGFFTADLKASCIDPSTGSELWAKPLGDDHLRLDGGVGADRLLVIKPWKGEKTE